MRTIRSVAELRDELDAHRRAGRTIGLVPTMGALHDGHLSLMRLAREQCDVVIASLFVNPAQFNEQADLAAYPRDEARDEALASAQGVDYLFAPNAQEVYPAGFATNVSVAGVSERLEGAQRGHGHFDGVTTVVAKLFNMVAPDRAYFGQKDAQQVAVIGRMVRDLDIPVGLVVGSTVREPDGLAMSSRNAHLSEADRARAAVLYRALQRAEHEIASGERDAAGVARAARDELSHEVELEYFELVHPETFAPVREPLHGDVLAVVAARVGATRLIDNQPIHVPSTGEASNGGGSSAIGDEPAGSPEIQEALTCSARC